MVAHQDLADLGALHGNYKHGRYTAEAIASCFTLAFEGTDCEAPGGSLIHNMG
jgi:hypothetical protein